MKCLETRTLENGLKWRRYRTEDGLIVKTYEVPESVWNSIVKQGRMKDRLAQAMSVQARAAVRCEVMRKLADGWKPIAVAHEHGLHVRTVERWRAADLNSVE